MKILFFCGSAEPGKNGVGDYTRRLCGEIIRKGHEATIISLCDKQAEGFLHQTQMIEGTKVTVRRISIASSYRQRLDWTTDTINKFVPDWISLQFVPYSYQQKGLPLWLPLFLKNLKGDYKRHIMFHELWLGIEKESGIKKKLIGGIQIFLIKLIVKAFKAIVVQTQSTLHVHYLNKHNIAASLLPLFGNIPVVKVKKLDINRSEFILVFFGTIHSGAIDCLDAFIFDLKQLMIDKSADFKFIFVGRNGEMINSVTEKLKNLDFPFKILGELNEGEISKQLSEADYGISTTPYTISEKSGAIAAMKEHGLNVLCVSKEWNDNDNVIINHQHVFEYKKSLVQFVLMNNYDNNNLDNITNKFLKSIKQ
jgi:hypothetical protein